MDVGTGNGNFAISMGKILKLSPDSIYGCDLENFSEQKDWKRGQNKEIKNKFVFNLIELNKVNLKV